MIRELILNERVQFSILAGLSVAVVAFTSAAYLLDRSVFKRFLGEINPIVASLGIVLLGGALLSMFLMRGWFAIYSAGRPGRYLWMAGAAVFLAAMMILVDSKIVLGEDINAPFPVSLLYYPAVGYAAEVIFQLLPLFILLTITMSFAKGIKFEVIVWPCIVAVSMIEPVFQARPMVGKYPAWATAYVALNVWIISFIQLALFKRYDFISMYSFRLMYYLLWHIAWGPVRLRLLF